MNMLLHNEFKKFIADDDDEEEGNMIPYTPVQYSHDDMLSRADSFYSLMSKRRSCR